MCGGDGYGGGVMGVCGSDGCVGGVTGPGGLLGRALGSVLHCLDSGRVLEDNGLCSQGHLPSSRTPR